MNILIISGHPNKDSFNGAIADAYRKSAKKAGHKVKLINIGELSFDPILHKGYAIRQELEPDLINAQKDILWANKIVIVFPTWWFDMPSILKGFFDRIILPGFGFKYKNKNALLPQRLLKNKKAEIITTVDGPKIFYLFFGHPGIKALKYGILKFCGITTTKILILGSIKRSSESKRKNWLKKIHTLGQQK